MVKMSAAEEIKSLKFHLKDLEAEFISLSAELAGHGIINDKEFQKGSDDVMEYMQRHEEECEMNCNNTITYTNIKSNFVKNEIKKTSWKNRAYIDDMMNIEKLVSGKTFGLPTGYIRKHLKKKYPHQWKAIWLELDAKGYKKALQLEQKEKEKEQQFSKEIQNEINEEKQRKKQAWKHAGGLR